jgi:hypothetical protein
MALVLKDRVQETSTTAGTGTLTLAGAVAGFQSFAAIGNGNTTYYSIVDSVAGTWEVGIGTYTSSGTTLSRDTVLSSSSGTSLISFAANSKSVFCTYPSEQGVWLDASGKVVQTNYGAITATSIALTTGTISTTPSGDTDIANKLYVDNTLNSVNYHAAANYATTADLGTVTYNNGTSGVGATITKTSPFATLSIDGASPSVGQRILVKNETSGQYNGVYTVTNVGSGVAGWVLTRASDYDQTGTGANEIAPGDYIFVISGTANANTAWIQSTDLPITIGTTPITFVQVAGTGTYAAGTGLTLTANTFSITNTGTAGTYGSASTVPVFVTNAQGQVTSVTNTSIAISGSQVTSGTIASAQISGSYTGITGVGTIATGVWNGTSITTAYGGTGVSTYTAGDMLYYAAGTAMSKLAIGSANYVLTSSGTAPQYVAQSTLSVGTASTATNVAGGAANQIHYQSSSGVTAFATAPSSSGTVLNWNGSAFTWVNGTISGVALGSNLSSLTFGTYLTAGGSSYNGSGAVTISTNATNLNTASTLVARDASGNFSAGTITATLSGNASTATSATSAGSVTNSVTFNNGGTGAASGTTYNGGSAVTVSYNTVGASPLAGSSSLTTTGTVTSGTWSASFGAVSGANLTSLTAGNLTGTIPSGVLGNSTVYIGTTAVALNRGSASISLTGTSIDGNAGTVTNGLYTTSTSASVQFGSFGVGTAASGTTGEIRATNNVTAYYSSDAKFKENIHDVPNALEIVCAIGSKLFDWKDEYLVNHGGEDGYFVRKSDFGVIAQDVEKVFSRAVRTREDGSLAVDYEKLSTLAFGAIAQLLERVEALENK